jgi:hypothetical protein
MEKCAVCKVEQTMLYESGVAICLKCADARAKRNSQPERKPPATEQDIRRTLLQDVLELTARTNEAAEEFRVVMGRVPSGLPHPDGAQRIKNASSKLTIARKELMKAHTRLHDYVERGNVLDDLKRSG